jgi:hypothetical protein
MQIAQQEAKHWYQVTPSGIRGYLSILLLILDFDFDEHGLLRFQVNNWLSGHEYAFILRHYRAYLQCYPDKIQVSDRAHPASIYENPKGIS